MRRKRRNPEKFDPVQLFTAMGRDLGYTLDTSSDVDDFMNRIGQSLKASLSNPALLHGKRVEALFAHVAGALGRCKAIKQEDSGAIFVAEDNLEVPDYRIFLNDGSGYLVEVKNFRPKDIRTDFTISKDYLERLEAYAELNKLPLKIAVYFSNSSTWLLLSKKAFTEVGNSYRINFIEAVARNEMALLGDRMIATLPDLRIEFLGDPDECVVPDAKGDVHFTVRNVRIYGHDQEVTDEAGKSIAFYMMRFGEWAERDSAAIMQDGKVVGLQFIFSPREPVKDQGLQIVGTLSTMVSIAWSELTVKGSVVVSLDVKQDPDVFSLGIPEGYKGSLPLWQFILQPNYDMKVPNFSQRTTSN